MLLRKVKEENRGRLLLLTNESQPVGMVEAIGSDVTLVSVGEKVMFSGYPLGSLEENGEEFAIFHEDNILGRYTYEATNCLDSVSVVSEDAGNDDAACGTCGGNVDLVHPMHEQGM